MNKKSIIFGAIILTAIGAAGFLIFRYQVRVIQEISEIFNQKQNLITDFSEEMIKYLTSNATSTEKELAALKQEVEELKKQKETYQSALTPASPPSTPPLKTKEDLDSAKQRIASLEEQLQQIQKQPPEASPAGGQANLVQAWQASEKVVQIACQDKIFGNWQLGSGVLISEDGKILTNQHVIPLTGGLAPDYCLALFNKDYDSGSQTYKREYRATIAGVFNGRDAALLKVKDVIYKDNAGQIQTMPILNSFQFFRPAGAAPQIGDEVYVIGFPESAKLNFSVTKGIISNMASGDVYFGTDAQIDRGNSGGAAVSGAGQLVGLPTYKYAGGGDYRGYILDIHSLNLN